MHPAPPAPAGLSCPARQKRCSSGPLTSATPAFHRVHPNLHSSALKGELPSQALFLPDWERLCMVCSVKA